MQHEIKNRFTGAVLYTAEIPDDTPERHRVREAVEQAVKARANLDGANLARADLADAYLDGANLDDANLAGADLDGADLAGADLAGAYLDGANLAGADLAGADLDGANLADAYLDGANLAGANLADANLAGASLAGANLAGAYLAGASLARADLADANLAGANLAGADLADAYLARAYLARASNIPAGITATSPAEPYQRDTRPRAERQAARAAKFREQNPDVPVVEALDAKILEIVEGGQGNLEMDSWHTCSTTHCRAGWAIHLAGEAGYELEDQHGSANAGRMIYMASVGRAPHFYASNERALEDLREQAALQSAV